MKVAVGGYFFFFNDTATTEIYTLSLHDALPICWAARGILLFDSSANLSRFAGVRDRKSTRLNSSHVSESRMPSSACKKKGVGTEQPRLLSIGDHRDYRMSFRAAVFFQGAHGFENSLLPGLIIGSA